MKKLWLPLLAILLVLSACGQNGGQSSKNDTKSFALKTAKGEDKVDIPKDPKRIVVLAPTYAGGLKYLGGKIVGVSDQIKQSPVLSKEFKDVDKVGAEDVEKVATLKPDLSLIHI